MSEPEQRPKRYRPASGANNFFSSLPPGATWGFGIGTVAGALIGMAIGAAWLDYSDRWVVLVASGLTAWGGAGGAVIGGTRDILNHLRQKDSAQRDAEADYGEYDRPASGDR
jgi:hypothetical protein